MALAIPSRWRRLLKIAAIAGAIAVFLFVLSSWILFRQRNELILDELQSYLDKSQSGQVEIGTMDLQLFRHFPQVTLSFDSVRYFEKRDTARQAGEAPIFAADRLYVALAFWPLVNGHVEVSDISLTRGSLNIIEYAQGQLNLDRAMAKPVQPGKKPAVQQPVSPPPAGRKKSSPSSGSKPAAQQDAFRFAIEHLRLNALKIRWHSIDAQPLVLTVKELDTEVSVDQDEKRVRGSLMSSYSLDTIRLNRTRLPKGELSFAGMFEYDVDSGRMIIENSKVSFDAFEATAKGYYQHKKNRLIDIDLDASTNDLPLLSRILRPGRWKTNRGVLQEGDIFLKGRVFGELGKNPPQVDLTFGVSQLALQLPRNLGDLRDLGFEGTFTSGPLPDYSQAELNIRNIRGEVPGGSVRGRFYLANFAHPMLRYRLDAELNVAGYDELFAIEMLSQLKGKVAVHARFDGPLDLLGTHAMDSSRSSTLQLDSISFILNRSGKPVHGLSARLETQNNLSILKASLGYDRDDVTLDATIQNLMHFLFKGERTIKASGRLESSQFYTEDLVLDSSRNASVRDRFSQLHLNFDVDAHGKEVGIRVKDLSCSLDKLPDIPSLDVAGTITPTDRGLSITLDSVHATLPQGKVDVRGKLLIPKAREIEFQADLRFTEFPWTYVSELAAEIRDGAEPKAKKIPVSQMELLTADLKITSAMRTYPYDIRRLELKQSKASFRLRDGRTFSVDNLEANLEPLFFNHPPESGSITGLINSRGSMQLTGLRLPGLTHLNVSLDIDGKDDQLDLAFKSQSQRAKSEDGHLRIDFSGSEPQVAFKYEVMETPVEDFVQRISKKKFVEGPINYGLALQSHGKSWVHVLENLGGTVTISSDSLRLYGVDIDDVLTKYKKSQRFNLADVGAVVLAGPVGIVATKGTDFVMLANVNLNDKQFSTLDTLVARWKLDRRVLTTEDVAIATRLNRIAFTGAIDFARDSIPGLQIAVVDKNGCSLMDQQVYGKFTALKTGKLNVAKTLLGSVINFVDALVGKDCKPVYSGSVGNPQSRRR